jgi:hypothetical protein
VIRDLCRSQGCGGAAACGLIFGLACGPEIPADLGDHEADLVELDSVPQLAHLAAALDAPAGVRAMDALAPEGLSLVRAPDPSPWLTQEHEAHRARLAAATIDETSARLRVLTYNTGLLRRWYALVITEVPHYDVRRHALPPALFTDPAGPWDVLMLQEVWETEDADIIAAAAAREGYAAYGGSERGHTRHGLMILVREDSMSGAGFLHTAEHHFELQRRIETYPGPEIERGWIEVEFEHPASGRTIRVFDTHAQSFAEHWRVRTAQARELALASRRVGAETLAIVGGDLNAMAYYPLNVLATTDGTIDGDPIDTWWQNASMYGLLHHYGELHDAWVAVHPPDEVGLLNALPSFSGAWAETPYGSQSWCDDVNPFSAVDCNGLHLEQYGGTEYPSRIDLVTYRDPRDRVLVESAELVFTVPVDLEGAGQVELSDHYGVSFSFVMEPGG